MLVGTIVHELFQKVLLYSKFPLWRFRREKQIFLFKAIAENVFHEDFLRHTAEQLLGNIKIIEQM